MPEEVTAKVVDYLETYRRSLVFKTYIRIPLREDEFSGN
jgi:hypothetical protein